MWITSDVNLPQAVLDAHSERIYNSSSNYLIVHQVKDLIGAVRGALGGAGVEPLVDAATARGFFGGSKG